MYKPPPVPEHTEARRRPCNCRRLAPTPSSQPTASHKNLLWDRLPVGSKLPTLCEIPQLLEDRQGAQVPEGW